MVIERTKDEILVRIPANVDVSDIQTMLDYLRYKELTYISKANQAEVDSLAKEVNKSIFSKIKNSEGFD